MDFVQISGTLILPSDPIVCWLAHRITPSDLQFIVHVHSGFYCYTEGGVFASSATGRPAECAYSIWSVPAHRVASHQWTSVPNGSRASAASRTASRPIPTGFSRRQTETTTNTDNHHAKEVR